MKCILKCALNEKGKCKKGNIKCSRVPRTLKFNKIKEKHKKMTKTEKDNLANKYKKRDTVARAIISKENKNGR